MKKLNRYLQMEYAPVPVKAELDDWTEMELLEGEVPVELNGYFLRNSSNPQFTPANKYHWFDGDGFIQGIHLSGGKARFKGKFVRTRKFEREQKRRKSVYGGLRGPISQNDFVNSAARLSKFVLAGTNPFGNTSNTDLVFHNGRLLSLWMLCGEAYEIDLPSLETVGVCDFSNGRQRVEHGVSAHPKTCPKDGTLFIMDFVSSWKRFEKPHLWVSSISEDGSEIKTRKFTITGRHLLHDMAVTENYVVLLDMPAAMTPLGMKYQREKGTHFGICRTDFSPIPDPETGEDKEIIWFSDPSGCYIIHVVNAYEENGKVILFALRKDQLKLSKNPKDSPGEVFCGYLHKWECDLKSGKIRHIVGESYREHYPVGSEFPVLNPSREGLKNRYSYLPGVAPQNRFNFDSFSKFDHEELEYEKVKYPKNWYVGEVRFVEHPNANGKEDKGWVLAFVHHLTKENSEAFFEIYDAENLGGGPVARLRIPVHIPIGFHTVWIDQVELGMAGSPPQK